MSHPSGLEWGEWSVAIEKDRDAWKARAEKLQAEISNAVQEMGALVMDRDRLRESIEKAANDLYHQVPSLARERLLNALITSEAKEAK